jgi:hypothetical protein
MILRFNAGARVQLNIETQVDGVYTTDVAFWNIDRMIEFCEANEFNPRRISILMQELEQLEMVLKDILQYFMYFIRPDFRQKPDIESATEKYKEIADKQSIEELKALIGKRNKIDFAALGSDRIDLPSNDEIEYDPDLDGSLDEYSDKESELLMTNEDDEMDKDLDDKLSENKESVAAQAYNELSDDEMNLLEDDKDNENYYDFKDGPNSATDSEVEDNDNSFDDEDETTYGEI